MQRNAILKGLAGLIVSAGLLLASGASAGPVIIDGTDANQHGSFNGINNVAGWLYMEKVLDNLGSNLGGGVTSKNLVVLGVNGGVASSARNSIQSAFAQSSLAGSGWSIVFVDGAANITNHLNTMNGSNTGILYIPTVNNAGGDMDNTELTAVNSKGAQIAALVAAGAGLFAQGESPGAGGPTAYGWLTSLIPTIAVTDVGGGGVGADIALTPAGAAAFPGLTNADLAGADPWHNNFTGTFGSLQVLGVSSGRNIIIGGGTSTVITAPEPGALALFGAGLAGLGFLRRRRRAA
jgi:hypothetical protein